MKLILFVLLSGMALISVCAQEASPLELLAKRYPRDMARANQFVREREQQLTRAFQEHGGTPELLCSIVFPEILRFSILRDSIETSANEVFYIQMGSDYSNFSIGPFQMKPSFAEYIERESRRSGIMPNVSVADAESSVTRRIRLSRLTQIDGAKDYLVAFEKLMRHRFPEVFLKPQSEQVLFLASAYNAGPHLTRNEIHANQHRKCYPHGCRASDFAYAEIAQAWFESRKGTIGALHGTRLELNPDQGEL